MKKKLTPLQQAVEELMDCFERKADRLKPKAAALADLVLRGNSREQPTDAKLAPNPENQVPMKKKTKSPDID
jgi:hypothetical protein